MAPRPGPAGSGFDIEAQRATSQLSPVTLGVNIRNNGGDNDTTTQAQDQIQAEAQAELERAINTIIEEHAIDPPLQGPPDSQEVIGDFEGSANALWTIFGKEVKSHDKARMKTLKGDMDGVLIFAGLFSAVITGFALDGKQNLKPSPQDQMVYYLQQNVAMLDQISNQISSIAPQVSIPSTLPPPFPAFKPLASDIRVNVFWLMALIFSLSAALLAILVQQWVRDYMQVFERYSDPLKTARLRQYLNEGWEEGCMPVIAEAVPGLLHVSLFLFFVGLCDSVLKINTAVGVSTTVPIGIIGLVYIYTIIAPVIYPQSPYQNPFSGLIWYLIQKSYWRRYMDWDSDGALKSLSMAEGQMESAMEGTEARKGRDQKAIRLLVGNMIEDAEVESLVMAIPGSFYGEWGLEVWKKIGDGHGRNNDEPPSCVSTIWNIFGSIIRQVRTRAGSDSLTNPTPPLPAPHSLDARLDSANDDMQVERVLHELSGRIRPLLERCKNQGPFPSTVLWRQRTRACIETTASLVCYANAKLDWFGDIVKLLGDIGVDQDIRELSFMGKDQSFVMRWTCLSLLALRQDMERDAGAQALAKDAVEEVEKNGREPAQRVDESFDNAYGCLGRLWKMLGEETNPSKEQVEGMRHSCESEILELERINIEADWSNLDQFDFCVSMFRPFREETALGIITRQLPGVRFDDPYHDIKQAVAVEWCRNYIEFPIIFPGRILRSICSFASTFREEILQGDWNPVVYKETFYNLRVIDRAPPQGRNPYQRMFWRMQDLSDGGGLGFTVELFFLSLKELLFTYSDEESHSALYIGTFRALTSDWSKYKHSLGTQKLLLNIITADFDQGPIQGGREVSSFDRYPTYIQHEFLVLLGNVFAGQTGLHIDNAVQQLVKLYDGSYDRGAKAFLAKALKALPRARRPPS